MKSHFPENHYPKPLRVRYAIVIVLGICVLAAADQFALFSPFDRVLQDVEFRLRGVIETPSRVLIVAVDERALESLGRWPIDRSHYARLLDGLEEAAAVGFDVVMSEPTEEDELFGEAMERHGRVVLPMYVSRDLKRVLPADLLSRSASRLGHIHMEVGPDGIVRQARRTVSAGGRDYSSMACVLADSAGASRCERSLSRSAPGEPSVNTEEKESIYINYYGPPGSFYRVSLVDVLDGKFTSGFFKNKIVLVGVTAEGIEDGLGTPFSRNRNQMAGVELQATVLGDLLDGNFLKPLNGMLQFAAAVSLFLIVFFLSIRPEGFGGLGTFSLILAGPALLQFQLFARAFIWIPPSTFLFALVGAAVVAHVFKLERLGLLLTGANRDWRDSFDSIADGIVVLDPDLRRIKTNRAAEKMLDDRITQLLTDRAGTLKQQSVPSSRAGRRDAEPASPMVEEVSEAHLSKHFEITSLPRIGPGDEFAGSVHVLRDVTDEKISEYERKVLQEQLKKVQKTEAIAVLAEGIAHDFNNILAVMMGYAEASLLDMPANSGVHGKIEKIVAAGERGKELVGQILRMGKDSEEERRPVRVRSAAGEILKLLKAAVPANIRIEEAFESDGSVMANPSELYQVLMNLCVNSAQAMQEKGGLLKLSTEEVEVNEILVGTHPILYPGRYLQLNVEDTGHGIPSEIMEKIFQPHFTTKARGKGTGLGLATAVNIVEKHGGAMGVESTVGEGTVFRVFLPLTDHSTAVEERRESDRPVRGRERILFVDDEENLLEIGKDVLTRLGYQVITFEDPREALSWFSENPQACDLVVTDMTMPYLTGDILARRLREIRQDIPVILCSGFSPRSDEEAWEKSGFQAVMTKPYTIGGLSRTLRNVLDQT
jgi:CHASE2 domain-containing sensor protein/nitrogen-specific signal transduction histidine kinase